MKLPDTKAVVAFYVAAVFLVGAVAGGTVGYRYSHRETRRPPEAFDPNAMRQKMKERFTKELSLTAEQQQQIEGILKKNMDEFGSALHENSDHIREVMKSGRNRIAAILTAEQQAKFEAMERARMERDKRVPHGGPHDHGEPPPGPPPGK